MSFLRGFRGIVSLIGRAPLDDFEHYFGPPKAAFQSSLAAVGGSIYLIILAAQNVMKLQRRDIIADEIHSSNSAMHIGLTAFFYLLAFTGLAFLLSLILSHRQAFYRWASVRHWAVFYALIPTTLALVLAGAGLFPAVMANAILFIAFIGWLFADIRLAQKLGEMGLMSAIFTGCIVHAMGLLILLTSIVRVIQ